VALSHGARHGCYRLIAATGSDPTGSPFRHESTRRRRQALVAVSVGN
jgi:hypothetical protein